MAEILVMGSAAAEGIPAMFCNCRVCRNAWEKQGKEMRFRTAYKLNDAVRIDFGPDTMAQEFRYRLQSEKLKHLFITHDHEDHFCPDMFAYRKPGFSVVDPDNILNVYGNTGAIHMLQRYFWGMPDFTGDYGKYRLNPVTLESFKPVVLEDQDMELTPLPAYHQIGDNKEAPQFFVIRIGKSWAMIANDTGYFREPVWEFLEQKHFRFDVVIADCTSGIEDNQWGHMGGKFAIETKQRLEKIGCVTENTQYFINHFSHNGKATHPELEEHFRPYQIQVCYDGLKICF